MALSRRAAWLAVGLLAACGPHRPPPPHLLFDGLPVSGSVEDARRAGFTDCVNGDAISMTCRRHGVMLEGTGPYEASIDLVGGDGSGGFDQLVLWHERDQYAVYAAVDALQRHGWRHCNTGSGDRGDQVIYTRQGEKVRASMDLSYWSKRRLRLLPPWNREPRC